MTDRTESRSTRQDPLEGYWFGAARGRMTVHVIRSITLDDMYATAFCGKSMSHVYRTKPAGRICGKCRAALSEVKP